MAFYGPRGSANPLLWMCYALPKTLLSETLCVIITETDVEEAVVTCLVAMTTATWVWGLTKADGLFWLTV